MKRGGPSLNAADEARPTAASSTGSGEDAGNDTHYITIRTHRRYTSLDKSEAKVRAWTGSDLNMYSM